MTGAMHTAAQPLLSAILALLPSPHPRDSLKAPRFLLLQGHGKARPPPSPASCIAAPGPPAWPGRKRKQPCTWPGEAQALGGPGPGHPGKARPLSPPAALLFGKWGLHLVALYLVHGDLRVPWVYRLWRGKGGKSLFLLALRLLAALPPWRRKAFRVRVVADAAFGTLRFLTGVRGMGLEAVVGMRRDRRTREGQRLLKLRRQGSKVYRGLAFAVWVSGYRYPLPKGRAEVPHRAFLQGHEQRVFFGAMRPENPLRGASFTGALLSRLPAGARSRRERG
jgi:hypothetical protein